MSIVKTCPYLNYLTYILACKSIQSNQLVEILLSHPVFFKCHCLQSDKIVYRIMVNLLLQSNHNPNGTKTPVPENHLTVILTAREFYFSEV